MKVTSSKSAPATKPQRVFFPLLLAVVVALLFWKSFLPGYVHFSNDGPLGQQNAAYARLPAAFSGVWSDLNDIGNSGGTASPDLSTLFSWLAGPVGYSKFLAPFALFILGLGAWTFFRQLKLSPLAAALGGLAAALDSAYFSNACWGVASQQIAVGMIFFALALVVSNSPDTPLLTRCVRLMLAGLAVGVNVMEGADNGAIFSVFVAAFVVARTLADEPGSVAAKVTRGVGRVVVIAVFAGFVALQTVISITSTYFTGNVTTGNAGTGQDAETKARQWNFATQWSEPKIETLGLFVPGLFGYRMDTPKDMMESLQDTYQGGNYWGAVGRDVAWDRYFAGDRKGPAPDTNYQYLRFSGGGSYQGIFVALIAFWAMAQSFRRRDSVFSGSQRRIIWFWTGVMILALMLAWGRFAPFYQFFYALPYSSMMRNPTKFISVFSWAFLIVFAYGVHGLCRRYLEVPAATAKSSVAQLQSWWKNVRGFDRRWTLACVFAVAGSILAWLIYASQKANLVRYLHDVGFPDKDMATLIAGFSIGQVGWFVLFFALAAGLCALVTAGVFAGKRAKLGGILLGALLIVDLGRANLPWIIHWNYEQKYASNPVVDILRDKRYEHRVVDLRSSSLFEQLYKIEWVQQLFPYYNIQSLDLVMRPRVGSNLELYESMLLPTSENKTYLLTRHWQLANVRYLLGPAAFLDQLNQQLDPAQRRFRIVQRFNVVPKPGIKQVTQLEELTAVPDDNGPDALFEFTGGADEWALLQQAGTNDFLTLKELTSASFDPSQTVLLADSPAVPNPPATTPNENSGTVEFTSYATSDIKFRTQAATPTVLLLNDQYDPNWHVTVDGKPAPLLRANFIMRGVYLTHGEHNVEFQFSLPVKSLYVTLSAMAVGIILSGVLIVLTRKPQTPAIN